MKFNLFFVILQALILINFVYCHHRSHYNRSPKQATSGTNVANTTTSTSDSAVNDSGLQPMKYGWDTSGKYFASVWDSKKGGTYTAKADEAGKFSVEWKGVDDIVVGKGWQKGSTDRVVNFEGQFEVNGNGAYLSVYGWSIGQCVEYYVVESWGEYKPCNGAPAVNKGTFESDGASYTACTIQRSSGCIDGSQGYVQFWSVREAKRTSGKVTFANHVAAWDKFGMKLGQLKYPQILAVEAYAGSSGSATMSIDGST